MNAFAALLIVVAEALIISPEELVGRFLPGKMKFEALEKLPARCRSAIGYCTVQKPAKNLIRLQVIWDSSGRLTSTQLSMDESEFEGYRRVLAHEFGRPSFESKDQQGLVIANKWKKGSITITLRRLTPLKADMSMFVEEEDDSSPSVTEPSQTPHIPPKTGQVAP